MLEGMTIAYREDGAGDVIIPIMSVQYDIPSNTWYVRTLETKYDYVTPIGSILATGSGSTLEAALRAVTFNHMIERKRREW